MTLLLSGTDGLSDVDGSAATPAIRGTDTNTGIFFPAADTIAFAEGGAEVARFNASGNLGLGTASPNGKLDVAGTIMVSSTDGNSGGIISTSGEATLSNKLVLNGSRGAGGIVFQANSAEAMRITSGGDLLIGTTDDTDQRLRITNNGTTPSWGLKMHNTATSGDNKFIEFGTQAGFTARGSITYNRGAGTVAYNTTSDSRLKDNIEYAPSALSKINSVQIRSYDWKETGNHVDFGVIAQELIQVAPEAVTEGIDNEDGTIKSPWAVDTAALVPAMIKAIQEQQAIITDLKARIETLENK